jgi:hypothetical protein
LRDISCQPVCFGLKAIRKDWKSVPPKTNTHEIGEYFAGALSWRKSTFSRIFALRMG